MDKIHKCAKKLVVLMQTVVIIVAIICMTGCGKPSDDFEYILSDGGAVLTAYTGSNKRVVVPDEIDGYMVFATEGTFRNNEIVEKVILPEGIEIIGTETFYGCEELESVTIPDTVTYIGKYAFAESTITELTLPDAVTVIDDYCFENCKRLLYIDAGAADLKLGHHAFEGTEIGFIRSGLLPEYYPDTFSEECEFSSGSKTGLIWKHWYKSDNLLRSMRFFRRLPAALGLTIQMIVFFLLVIGISVLVRVLKRAVRKRKGTDEEENYRIYSERCMKGAVEQNSEAVLLYNNPPVLRRDRIKGYINIALCILMIIAVMVLLISVYDAVRTDIDFFLLDILVNASLTAVVALGGCGLLFYSAKKTAELINIKRLPDKAKPRITKTEGREDK